MKKHKYFKPVYLINLSLFALLLLLQNINFFLEKNQSIQTIVGFFIVNSLIIILVLVFTKCCAALYKAYETETQLTKKSNRLGKIIVTLFTILTMLFCIGSIALLKMFLKDDSVLALSAIPIMADVVAISISITSTYLCFSYWMIQKRIKVAQQIALKANTKAS
jgi:cytochrome bd-type quinol oxidase subunit 2